MSIHNLVIFAENRNHNKSAVKKCNILYSEYICYKKNCPHKLNKEKVWEMTDELFSDKNGFSFGSKGKH